MVDGLIFSPQEWIEVMISCTLFALATNLDNLTLGIAYGIRKLTISFWGNLAIALLSGLSTYLSIRLGSFVNQFLPLNLAHHLGNGILIYLETMALLSLYQRPDENPQGTVTPAHQFHSLKLPDAIALGLALTLTNVGTGVAAGLAELNIVGATIFSFASSLLFIGGGFWLGHQLISYTPKIFGNRLEFSAACFLILLGLSGFVDVFQN